MTREDIRGSFGNVVTLADAVDADAVQMPDALAQARLMFRRAAVALRDAVAFAEAGLAMLPPPPQPKPAVEGQEQKGSN